MQRVLAAHRERGTVALLLGLAAGSVVATLLSPPGTATRAALSHGGAALLALVSGVVALRAARRPDAWRATPIAVVALLALAVVMAATAVRDLTGGEVGRSGGDPWVAAPFVVLGALCLLLYRREVREHLSREDTHEFLADATLLSVSAGALVFLLLRPPPGSVDGADVAVSAVIAASSMIVVAMAAALAVRQPTRMHVGMFAALALLAAAGIAFAHQWIRGQYLAGGWAVDVPFAVGTVALGLVLLFEPRLARRPFSARFARLGRPALTALAVAAACAGLAFVAVAEFEQRAGLTETSVVVVLLCAALAARILLNQLRGTRAGQQLAAALEAKEKALLEADGALTRLRELHRSLGASEERLRLLVDAAVDGIVELDARGVIRRANEAFCSMMGLPRDRIVGIRWEDLAEEIEGTGGSLATLPDTGRAVLPREDQDLHLEARASDLPGQDPGMLLVVRDVTAARVADQTIRSLFKFLQDRDEDRTRLLKRTNAAIEAERNRIARDIHDGPVQGVAAATLSLEAVLLMLRRGGVDKAISTLTQIREELAEETESLRRLMSDLRPPVLDERGLIPALREMLARFGRSSGIETHFTSRSLVDIAADVETLAYRIVQEALTNAGKHSRAKRVNVSVEAVAGQLRVEIVDDGMGFDPASAREFLRAGRVGLASMRERTELANGSLLVRSTPGGGTTIVATLPLDDAPIRAEAALR